MKEDFKPPYEDLEKFMKKLNHPPLAKHCKAHPRIKVKGKPLLYYPIDNVKQKLTYFFGPNWSWHISDAKIQDDVCIVRGYIEYVNPITRESNIQHGIGAQVIHKGQTAHTVLPASESFAFKNACAKIGQAFTYKNETFEFALDESHKNDKLENALS